MPAPNFFGGEVRHPRRADPVTKAPKWDHPFGVPNQKHAHGMMANYRAAGLADMAIAIAERRPHRCSLDAAPLADAVGWLTRYRVFWEGNLEQLATYLEDES